MNKKLKFKLNRKKCIVITIAAFLILCGLFGTYTYVRAGNFIYRHTSDELNMTVNSVTYYYNDSRWNKPKNKTYTISSNWVDSLAIKHDVLGLGTNTTVYGPYTWLPAGQYKVQYDFTKNGGDVFKYWDVVTNFGANGTEQIPRTSTDVVDIPGSGAYVESPYYWTDGNGKGHLSYIINTTGDAADYELRLFFSDNLGYELPEGSDYNSQKGNQTLYAFLENLSIESVNDNVITFDAQGGTVNGNATGTLLTTNWGKQRGNAPVPTRSGYVFDGWYGYSSASNMTDSRENLTFDTGSSEVKIWNTDGTPAIGTEVSYYGYEVHAKWIQVDQFVSYLGNGADNKEDYYISYNAAVTNQYNALDFKKTGYSGSRNWIQKDQFMNTTGTVSGSGRERMPQLRVTGLFDPTIDNEGGQRSLEKEDGLKEMLEDFRNFRRSPTLKEKIITLNRLEEEGDQLYTRAVHRLYTEENDAVQILVWTTIYNCLEECCDCCEHVADSVEMAIMKNT